MRGLVWYVTHDDGDLLQKANHCIGVACAIVSWASMYRRVIFYPIETKVNTEDLNVEKVEVTSRLGAYLSASIRVYRCLFRLKLC